MISWISVMAGGALGAAARYGVSLAMPWRAGFPWATFAVNVAGGFAMGLLMAMFAKGQLEDQARLFFGVGILGGFTTFSAFSMETVILMTQDRMGLAFGYVAASILASISAAYIGFGLARA